ncbi:MAG TPA: hypothetical protein VLD67_13155 [Vicinamibacterales bacterium]|nr:hypothetical protein [Vicinamibacterales bacterium]
MRYTGLLRTATAAVALSSLGLIVAAARSPQAPKAGGGSVTVDFRAFTGDSQPVRDLKAEDVTLRIDGKPRQIRSLILVDMAAAAGAAAESASPLPPPFSSNAATPGGMAGRDLLMLFDEESVVTGREDVMREAGSQLIKALGPRDRVGMASVRQGGPTVEMTTDHGSVREGISKLAGYSSGRELASDLTCRTSRTINVFQSLFEGLSPAKPTTVVFFSTSLAAFQSGQTARVGGETGSGTCQLRLDEFNRLGASVNASRASMYTVEMPDALTVSAPAEASGGLENLAGVTGGEHIRLSGASESQMERIARETSAYYVASFDPEPAERTGTSRRVEVRVSRESVRVRARPEIVIAKLEKTSPRDMIRVGNEFHDLPLRAAAFSSRNPDEKIKVIALFESLQPEVTLSAAMVGLFDPKGKLTAQWTAQRDDLSRRPTMAALTVPPGTYRMRVAATDSAGRSGSVDVNVEAALVSAGPIQLSDLLLGTPGDTGAPTLQFQDEQEAVAMVELYGRPTSPITAYIEVLPGLDQERITAAALAPSRTNEQDRFVLSAAIPLGTLAPGDYLIRATVAVEGQPEGRVMHTLRKVRPEGES